MELLSKGFQNMDFGGHRVQNCDLLNKFKEEREMHEFYISAVGEPISHGDRRTLYLAQESEAFEKFLRAEKSIMVDDLKVSSYNSSCDPQIITDEEGNRGIHHTFRPPNPFKTSCLNVWREIDNVVVPHAAKFTGFDSEKMKRHEIIYVNEVKRNCVEYPYKKIEIYKFKGEDLKDDRADWYGSKALKSFFVEPNKYLLLMRYITELSSYTGRFLKNDSIKKVKQMVQVLKCASLRHLREIDWEENSFENLCIPPAREEFCLLFGGESVEQWLLAWDDDNLPAYLFKSESLAIC